MLRKIAVLIGLTIILFFSYRMLSQDEIAKNDLLLFIIAMVISLVLGFLEIRDFSKKGKI